MSNTREFWRQTWNHAATSDSMFVQIGRSSWTPLEFFLLIKDAASALELKKEDVLLDAGGGSGWISMSLSPFVKEITLFDFAQEMVNKAKASTALFDNINVFWDDILSMQHVPKNNFSKVLVGSVLQYLENYEQVEKALSNLYNVMLPGARAIFMHNPDLELKDKHIQSYARLNYDKERLEKAITIEELRLWLDIKKILPLCTRVGFSKCYKTPINNKLWQSTHMFDFVVEK